VTVNYSENWTQHLVGEDGFSQTPGSSDIVRIRFNSVGH